MTEISDDEVLGLTIRSIALLASCILYSGGFPVSHPGTTVITTAKQFEDHLFEALA